MSPLTDAGNRAVIKAAPLIHALAPVLSACLVWSPRSLLVGAVAIGFCEVVFRWACDVPYPVLLTYECQKSRSTLLTVELHALIDSLLGTKTAEEKNGEGDLMVTGQANMLENSRTAFIVVVLALSKTNS